MRRLTLLERSQLGVCVCEASFVGFLGFVGLLFLILCVSGRACGAQLVNAPGLSTRASEGRGTPPGLVACHSGH